MKKNNVRYKETSHKFFNIKAEPMSFLQIFKWACIIMVILSIFVIVFKWNDWITEAIGMSVYLLYCFIFHLITPLTDHLGFSERKKDTLEINILFFKSFKLIKPNINNRERLISILSDEFVQALGMLIKNYPEKRYMTRTWLVPKKDKKYLEDYGFYIKKKTRSISEIIYELILLHRGNQNFLRSIKTMIKHKNYQYVWSKEDGEHLFSDLQNTEIRRKFRIPQNL